MTYKFFKEKISTHDQAIILLEWSTLLNAGISLLKCCEILQNSQTKNLIRIKFYKLHQEISAGRSLADGLTQIQLFDHLICHLISIAENTGQLDKIFKMIAEAVQKKLMLEKKLMRAMIYPLLVTIAAFILTIFLFLFIIPQFKTLFATGDYILPLPTQIIFWISDHVLHFLCSILFVFLFSYLFINKTVYLKVKNFMINHISWAKKLKYKILTYFFLRNLWICLNAGIPLLSALKLCDNRLDKLFTYHLKNIHDKLQMGSPFHEALEGSPFFSVTILQLTRIGEESGKLDLILHECLKLIGEEISAAIIKIHHLIEPLIMLFLGVLIGFIVVSIYLPLFNMGKLF